MLEIVQLIIIGIFLAGLGAMIVSRVRQRWLIRAILLWMFAPAIPIALILVLGTLGSPAPGSGAYNLAFGVVLIGAIILAPWIVVAGIGVAIGLKLRRKRPPEPPTSPAPSPSVQTAVIAPSPHFTQGSPDGVKEGVNAPTPGPFAAWRIALVILIGTLAAIAGLTYMSVTYNIDPPKLPHGVPHIPRLR